MKTTTKAMTFYSIMTILATGLLMTTTTMAPAAYAETTVSLPEGSAVPGCEETDACYIPSSVSVAVGETVTWSNDDAAAHTVTSGSPSGGADGIFDSGLFMASTTFSHIFDEEGTFDYYCMVHPWMVGSVMVGEAMATGSSNAVESKHETTEMKNMDTTESTMEESVESKPETTEMKNMDTTESTMEESVEFNVDYDITDGGNVINVIPNSETSSVTVELEATEQGVLTIILPRDVMDAKISDNEDDDFFVLIDGEEVVFEETKTDTDRTLAIEFSAGAEEVEIIGTFVVPEFGTVAMMVLAVAIISIVAVSARSRLSIMPRL